MLLVKIAYKEEHNFIGDIQDVKNILKNKGINIGMSELMENDTHFVKVFCDDSQYSQEVKSTVLVYITNILYNIIIYNFRQKELLEYLTENYFFLKHDEMVDVDIKINNILKQKEKITGDDSIFAMNRINSIQSIIKDFIEENDYINIDGYIRFRLKPISKYVEEIVDKVVEIFMVEKEYNEFINLLKYFVDIQDSKIDKINIIIKDNGEYEVIDGDGNDIFKDFINDLVENKDDKKINPEDIIISGLITNAPKEVCIYNKEMCQNTEFLNTITSVFRERVVFLDVTKIL